MVLRLLHYADLEDTYDDPAHIGRVAGLVDQLSDEQTVVIGAGDNIAPGSLGLATNCQHTLPFFEAIDADVETLGNHDFDYGTETLLSVIRASPQTWLCVNAYDGDALFGGDAGVVPWKSSNEAIIGSGCSDWPIPRPMLGRLALDRYHSRTRSQQPPRLSRHSQHRTSITFSVCLTLENGRGTTTRSISLGPSIST